MTDNEALEILQAQLPGYLRSKGYSLRKNIPCPSPEHPDIHPSAKFYPSPPSVYCFGCGRKFDIIDYIGFDYGLSSFKDKFLVGLSLYRDLFPEDYLGYKFPQGDFRAPRPQALPPEAAPADTGSREPDFRQPADYTGYFEKVASNRNPGYTRGLGKETLSHFKVGYDPAWKHPKAGNSYPSPRLIIPTSPSSYVARLAKPPGETSEKERRYAKMKVGRAHIFNLEILPSLPDGSTVFIVEGEIDAMSVYDCGFNAVGLGSASMAGKFIEAVRGGGERCRFIIAADSDAAGRRAAEKLSEGLSEIGAAFEVAEGIFHPYKDANEMLMADRALLIERLSDYTRTKEEDVMQESAKKTTKMREQIKEQFIKLLEEDGLEWVREWSVPDLSPESGATGKEYHGGNRLRLILETYTKGYKDKRWYTYSQIMSHNFGIIQSLVSKYENDIANADPPLSFDKFGSNAGGKVSYFKNWMEKNSLLLPDLYKEYSEAEFWRLENAKGKGVGIEYFQPYDQIEKKFILWEEYGTAGLSDPDRYAIKLCRTFYVFNGDLVSGLPEAPPIAVEDKGIGLDEYVRGISENMGVKILNDGGARAYYQVSTDDIHLPPENFFNSSEEYASAALHELGHATGHPSRLDRHIDKKPSREERAKEELVAELASLLMMAEIPSLGVSDFQMRNHAAYVQDWISAVRKDPNVLVNAFSSAEKAADYMAEKATLALAESVGTVALDSGEVDFSAEGVTYYVFDDIGKMDLSSAFKENLTLEEAIHEYGRLAAGSVPAGEYGIGYKAPWISGRPLADTVLLCGGSILRGRQRSVFGAWHSPEIHEAMRLIKESIPESVIDDEYAAEHPYEDAFIMDDAEETMQWIYFDQSYSDLSYEEGDRGRLYVLTATYDQIEAAHNSNAQYAEFFAALASCAKEEVFDPDDSMYQEYLDKFISPSAAGFDSTIGFDADAMQAILDCAGIGEPFPAQEEDEEKAPAL